jgi:hypothetical protein
MGDLSDFPGAMEESERPTSEWWYRRPGIVYFFGAGDPPAAIKIGVTTIPKEKNSLQEADWLACVRQRHKQIQSSNHETIKLLGVIRFIDGGQPARLAENRERQLHKQFADLQRFEPHTCGAEWFNPGTKLLAYIREHAHELGDYPGVIGLPLNR